MKMTNEYGVLMSSLESMHLSKYLSSTNIAMNTLYPKQRTELTKLWLWEHRMPLAHTLWEQLGNIPIDEEERIEEDYSVLNNHPQHFTFETGTDRSEIWQWFEEYFNLSVHDDLMFNQRV